MFSRSFNTYFKIISGVLIIAILVVALPSKQADAVDVTAIATASFACAGIGNALADMVNDLGSGNFSNTSGSSGGPTGVPLGPVADSGDPTMNNPFIQSISQRSTNSAIPTSDANTAAILAQDKKIVALGQQAARRKDCLDGIAYAAAKSALATMTNKTVKWADTGFNGNPLFLRDPQSYFQSLATQEISYAMSEIQKSNNPYAQSTMQSVAAQQQYQSEPLSQKLTSTFTPDTGFTPQQFSNSFVNGGWNAWNSYNLKPQNNPLGTSIVANNAINNNVASTQQNALNELNWNNGFLSVKTCTQTSGSTCLKYQTQTPGIIVQQQLSLVLGSPVRQLENANAINETLGAAFNALVNNLFGTGLANLAQAQNAAGYGTSGGQLTGAAYGDNSSTVQQLASSSFDANQVLQTPSWFGVTSNFDITNQAQFAQVIRDQWDYLHAMTGYTPTGPCPSNISPVAPVTPGQTVFLSNPIFETCTFTGDKITPADQFEVNAYSASQGSGPDQIQYPYVGSASYVGQQIVQPIAQLDMCLPGPNATWSSEVADRINQFVQSVASTTYSISNTPQQTQLPSWYGAASFASKILSGAGAALAISMPVIGIPAIILGQVLNGLAGGASASTAAEQAQSQLDQNSYATQFSLDQNLLETGAQEAYNDYAAEVQSVYPQNATNILQVAAPNGDAHALADNLRNYDTNVTQLSAIYLQREQQTQLDIYQLDQLWGEIQPILQAGEQQAASANALNPACLAATLQSDQNGSLIDQPISRNPNANNNDLGTAGESVTNVFGATAGLTTPVTNTTPPVGNTDNTTETGQ